MTNIPDFDAADLAGAILELDDPVTPASPTQAPAARAGNRVGSSLGWTLAVALIIAVSVAISLAVQLGPETSSPSDPLCGGLYDTCEPEPCDDADLFEDDGRRGLFDAEERFVDRSEPDRC